MNRHFLLLPIILYTMFMVTGFLQVKQVTPSLLITVFAIFWAISAARCWKIPATLMLVVVFLSAIIGVQAQVDFGWIMAGLAAGIIGWDLERFRRYLSSVDQIKSSEVIIKRHLIQLFGLVGISTLISVLSLHVTLQLNMYLVIFLICAFLLIKIER